MLTWSLVSMPYSPHASQSWHTLLVGLAGCGCHCSGGNPQALVFVIQRGTISAVLHLVPGMRPGLPAVAWGPGSMVGHRPGCSGLTQLE